MATRKDKPTPKNPSALPKKKPAAKPKKKTELQKREEHLKEIGFTWKPELKYWESPHGTCKIDRVSLAGLLPEDFPGIFQFYEKTGEFSQEIFSKICEEIATSSKSTRQVCKDNGIHGATFYRWLQKDQDDKGATYGGKLRDTYARAKEDQVEYLIDEMLEIADDGTNDLMTITKGDVSYDVENKEVTARSKIRLDTRKFIASKLKPKKYGESLDLTTKGEAIQQVAIFQIPDNGRDKK